MSYVIYDLSTSAIVETRSHRPYKVTSHYKTVPAAKAAITRMSKKWFQNSIQSAKKGDKVDFTADPQFRYGIADAKYYYKNIEKQVERTNFMTGQKFMESVNTPYYASPRSETYWSM